MSVKIFNISFHKNGTTSFDFLMKKNNLKSFHNTMHFSYKIMGFQNKPLNIKIEKFSNENKELHPSEKLKYFINYTELDNLINKFDAFSDQPFCYLYEYLDSKYPNSLFIYIHRDPEEWYNSINNHDKGYSNMRKLIYGYGSASKNKEKYIYLYKSHQKEVSNYFKDKKNFIKLNLDNPNVGKEICKFCKFKNIISFPHKNITKK